MAVTRQSFRDNEVAKVVPDRALSARSVLATALLGADQPRLTAAELVAVASLFGISGGAARTCLWRMVSSGELTSDDGTYALAGQLLERRERIDEASRIPDVATRRWDGTWELAVVSSERRSPAERLGLRKAATALHLAELREGVWMRPDNLELDLDAELRARVRIMQARDDAPGQLAGQLWDLPSWARTGHRLLDEMRSATDIPARFVVAAGIVRHLLTDPVLPTELLPADWRGPQLRAAYNEFAAELTERRDGIRLVEAT